MNREQFLKKAREHLIGNARVKSDEEQEAKQQRREDRIDEKHERAEEFDFERDQGARP